MKPRTTVRRLGYALLLILGAALLASCAFWKAIGEPILFPRPTPSPTATLAPTEAPRTTPRPAERPRVEPTATVRPAVRPSCMGPDGHHDYELCPTPTPTPGPRPAAPYICKWKVGDNKPKPAKTACHSLHRRPDGAFKCVKDSTDLYCTDDPLNRWPACRALYPNGAPMSAECTYPTKSANACLEATCSGGVPLARPRDWGNCSGPARKCEELTTGLLVSCTASGWQTTIIARAGARVRLETWAPDPSITCDGELVPVKPRAATSTWIELLF